jgi:hypothetical protein
MNRATFDGDIVVADGLPLQRLYARFDAIARGRAFGNSSAAHRSVMARLSTNQRRAESLGWSDFVLERAGTTGRLELRGVRAPGEEHELVPDAIPYDIPAPRVLTPSDPARDHTYLAGRFGNRLATVSWRSRMRWLDDGGR